LVAEGYEILLAPNGETALKVTLTSQPDVILLDVMMPGIDGFETCRQLKSNSATDSIPVIFISAANETQSMVDGFRAGGVDYITKPFQAEEVLVRVRTHLTNHQLNQEVIRKNGELERINAQLREEMNRREKAKTSLQVADDQLSLVSKLDAARWGIDRLVGTTPSMARIVDQIRKLQPATSTSVLITGESGPGKKLVARALHFGGSRSKKPFLPVNCSAVPKDLAESLFFGHVKGAFSGATDSRKGYFENADGGTLFLDEVGDMSAELQAKLLLVLETSKILPLGAKEERAVTLETVDPITVRGTGDAAVIRIERHGDAYPQLTVFYEIQEGVGQADSAEGLAYFNFLSGQVSSLFKVTGEAGSQLPGVEKTDYTIVEPPPNYGGVYRLSGTETNLTARVFAVNKSAGPESIEPAVFEFLRDVGGKDLWLKADTNPGETAVLNVSFDAENWTRIRLLTATNGIHESGYALYAPDHYR